MSIGACADRMSLVKSFGRAGAHQWRARRPAPLLLESPASQPKDDRLEACPSSFYILLWAVDLDLSSRTARGGVGWAWVRDRREAICPGSPRSCYSIKSRLRSDHRGFAFCIRAIFFDRRQPLSSFSRVMAKPTSLVSSKYTRRSTKYLLVKPGTSRCLCSYTRRQRSLVTPMYRRRVRLS